MPEPSHPLILTLALEAQAQAYFDTLRAQHFPPERNFIPAHLTLFHALPGEEEPAVLAVLREQCRQPPLLLAVSGLMKLGRGVAFRVESDRLRTVHRGLQERWRSWLTSQDRQGLHPHIVIQNKVEPAEARALHDRMAAVFQPFSCTAIGLSLWRYRGGPWNFVNTLHFMSPDASADPHRDA